MSGKSLPAYIQQMLELSVAPHELTRDAELSGLCTKLSDLNDKVESLKRAILERRRQASQSDS